MGRRECSEFAYTLARSLVLFIICIEDVWHDSRLWIASDSAPVCESERDTGLKRKSDVDVLGLLSILWIEISFLVMIRMMFESIFLIVD
jgi:hypothetical protein